MYKEIKLFFNYFNSISKSRLNLLNQNDYLKIYNQLKKQYDDNCKPKSISANIKQANTILMKLRLIVFLMLDTKTPEILHDLLEAILDMFLKDLVQFDSDDDHFSQALHNALYHESFKILNILEQVYQYLFLAFMLNEFFTPSKSIYSFFLDKMLINSLNLEENIRRIKFSLNGWRCTIIDVVSK